MCLLFADELNILVSFKSTCYDLNYCSNYTERFCGRSSLKNTNKFDHIPRKNRTEALTKDPQPEPTVFASATGAISRSHHRSLGNVSNVLRLTDVESLSGRVAESKMVLQNQRWYIMNLSTI